MFWKGADGDGDHRGGHLYPVCSNRTWHNISLHSKRFKSLGRLWDIFGSPKDRTEVKIGASRAKNCKDSHGNVRFCTALQKPTKNCEKLDFRSDCFFLKVGAPIFVLKGHARPIVFGGGGRGGGHGHGREFD